MIPDHTFSSKGAQRDFVYAMHNGHLYNNFEPIITADNRGFRYGDGLFETVKFVNGGILLNDLHFERLFHGLQLLRFKVPRSFTPAHLASLVKKLCKKNNYSTARVRITVFRGDGGLYDPEDHFPNCIIQSWALPEARFQLNDNGLVTGFYRDARKTTDVFANLKSNNYLPYIMAGLHVNKQQWNEAFLLNTNGNVCDATISNIFIIKNETIYTCPLQEGCVAGVMRRHLLAILPLNGFRVEEKVLSQSDVMAADEVFLTNVIKGVRWVSRCETATYVNQLTKIIFQQVVEKMVYKS